METGWLNWKLPTEYTIRENSMARTIKMLTLLQWIIGGMVVAIIIFTMWERFYPYKIITFWDATVLNADRVAPGNVVWIDLKYDKYMDIAAISTKVLVCDKYKMFMAQEGGGNPVGVNQENVIPVIVPSLTPDKWDEIRTYFKREKNQDFPVCFIRGTYKYTLGSGREIKKEFETQEFQVQ
jgi:hypothetical protein